ncbi:PTS transporter subunit EIIC [Lactococcus raffinolactis]|jgi:maltose PTS system EIICB or EIICBA component|uniref:PTS system maltose-specific IIA component, Glc family /PTS system maltose-specific IIB component, Glc family /PTS system maltose-specific IIC component, Glc family n=2 Tax=Pseudolactococcus TaxID=3436058 RepID=A0A1K2HJE8_9LACT|nr:MULTISPECIES: PTS transporter subunit IIBC [Lactococcus]MDT2767180.1 PTS transporter subunit IIBC [Lactococcus raffinolactis]MDT2790338.1 PTS transporter subunit IIBC [Lactococcus raffinolactis]PCR99260.1 PTS system, IIBC component [Lactococcus chungangensis CAU 28 = DSM 22330]QIW52247.1 PTS transporter subunit EIIC [Lactococcus raffinolactis]QIW61684.1 PTS transporter subunit EIIC [Lactococcus raffinolactis]
MKKIFSFEFWQKFGKALMVVVAVMPAAGLMISIGKSIPLINPDLAPLVTTGGVIENIGWAIIGNLHLLFALAIGGSWAKERAGGAFAAGISFILINRITGAIFGVTNEMLANEDAFTHTLFGTKIMVKGFFTSVLEAPALNMGVFVGIIAGFVGAMAYNKYYNYRKLPDALSFFNGKRFVPFVVILWSTIVALILAIVWPNVQAGINNFGLWIAESKESAPVLAPFLYGTLERLLLPFGLHHMLTIPINYTQLGGTYEILSGAQAGTKVFGQDPLWLAWATDLVNLKGAGDMSQYEFVLKNWTPARFKVGQMIGSSGILMGLALAMYRNVDPDKKSKYISMYFSAALAVFLTGVTEPLEFMFMFAAVPLYIVYSVIQGAAFAMADILHLRVHSFGNIELLTRTPLAIKAGLGIDLLNFVICVILFGVLTYFVANFLIKKFNYATPGRNGNYNNDSEETPSGSATNADQQIIKIIHLLGGKENIKDVDACMTRLRVSVEDPGKVGSEEEWKRAGAMGLIVKDKGVQAVYGPKADVLKSDIEDLLQSGADIPEPTVEATNKNEKNEEKHVLGIEKELFTVATGEVIALTDVNDPVFSQKMMGDGFAVIPATGEVTAPLSGKIVSVFPTKHAIGMQTAEGAEVLIHMGLDTVQMSQPAFEILVSEGQEVVAGTTIAQMNLDAIKNEGKETTIIVVFTDDKVNGLTINKLGDTERGTVIGKINL